MIKKLSFVQANDGIPLVSSHFSTKPESPNISFIRNRVLPCSLRIAYSLYPLLCIFVWTITWGRNVITRNNKMTSSSSSSMFSTLMLIIQVLVVFVLVSCVRISSSVNDDGDESNATTKLYSHDEYVILRDIMVMLLLGFGYLMTFLRKYGLGAVGFTMMLTAIAIQLNVIIEPVIAYLYDGADDGPVFPININISNVIDGEFSAATLLISYGVIIGRATPTQLVIMAVAQSLFYVINKTVIVFGMHQAEDVGGTLTIHMFGAYFGIAVSKMLGPPKQASLENSKPDAISDLLSLVGTTLLWVYWPSFVGATETTVPLNEKYCILHTIFALLGSTIASFYMTHKLRHGLLDPVHIANSTLAGGVAIGASARLNVSPGGAFLLGVIVGCVSVYGYIHVTPMLEEKFHLYDTCGVHNLHGMPSVVGGFASIIFVMIDSDAEFLVHSHTVVQVMCQFGGILGTIVFAILSGTVTGYAMVYCVSNKDSPTQYDDSIWWEGEYYTTNGKAISNPLDAEDNTNGHPDETTLLLN